MNEIVRIRFAVTAVGLVVALFLLIGGATTTSDQFISYQNSQLIRSIYDSAAGIVFILSLLPWAMSGSKA